MDKWAPKCRAWAPSVNVLTLTQADLPRARAEGGCDLDLSGTTTCLQFHSYISTVQSLSGELFISAGEDSRGERRWTRPFKGAGGLGKEELAAWCLFQRCQSLYGREGGRGTGRWAGKGPGQSHRGFLLSSPVGAEAEAVPREGRWPVAAEVWQGSFLQPQCGSNGDTPWASAGLGLAETFSRFRARVRRRRERNRTAGAAATRGLGSPCAAAVAVWVARARPGVSGAQKWSAWKPGPGRIIVLYLPIRYQSTTATLRGRRADFGFWNPSALPCIRPSEERLPCGFSGPLIMCKSSPWPLWLKGPDSPRQEFTARRARLSPA